MVNLEWYRTFKCIYECNNFTLAAKKLYMTQPGVSKQLSALEAHVGKQLFDRTPRKILPTEYGRFLYTQVVGFVEGLEQAEKKFKRGSNKSCPSIVVGCPYDLFRTEMLHQIGKINMYITFQFGKTEDLIDQLEKDKIHLMISEEKYSGYDHEFTLWMSGKLALLGSANLRAPFAQINKVNSKEIQRWLAAQTWYAYDNDLAFIKDFWKENFNARPNIMAKYVFPSSKDIIQALKHGEGLTVLPEYAGRDELKDKSIRLMFPKAKQPDYKAYWVYKQTTQYLHEIRLLINALNIK
jgi:DNA-binding transcriptional LysR family regulator